MDYRPLDITVISAKSLANVNFFMKMDVYVVVSLINGDSVSKQKTHVSKGRNPKWSHRIKFSIDESSIENSTLLFVVRCSRVMGDKDIGEVSIRVRDLLDTDSGFENEQVDEYQVRSIRGKSRGTLTFSYQFKEKFTQNVECGAQKKNKSKPSREDSMKSYTSGRTSTSYAPGMVYVMTQQGMPAPYPQAPYPGVQYVGAWFPQNTPGSYSYPPQQMGYGYNQPVQQQPPPKLDDEKAGGEGGEHIECNGCTKSSS